MIKLKNSIKRHAPTFLSIFACFGVIALVFTAVDNTIKAIDSNKKGNKDILKCFIPTISIGATTMACIISSNIINKNIQKSLMITCEAIHSLYLSYKESVEETVNELEIKEINTEMLKKHYPNGGLTFLESPFDNCLFYDWYGKRYFHSSMEKVLNAQYQLNRLTCGPDKKSVTINDLYRFLDLKPLNDGFDYMWFGNQWVDFKIEETELEDGLYCYIILPVTKPIQF